MNDINRSVCGIPFEDSDSHESTLTVNGGEQSHHVSRPDQDSRRLWQEIRVAAGFDGVAQFIYEQVNPDANDWFELEVDVQVWWRRLAISVTGMGLAVRETP